MRLKTLSGLFFLAGLLWPAAEVVLALATRARRDEAKVRDRGSLVLLWGSIGIGIGAGLTLRRVSAAQIALSPLWLLAISMVLFFVGLAVRLTAILTLGRLFTSVVTIQKQHRIVTAGMYRRLRHPSYSGLLLAFLGVALSYGNWLSLAGVMLPITAAVLYRIHVEEAALNQRFGQEYAEYRNRTRRLIPGIY
jgi:protein-S-isoprenylcysteine O-methyltransferase Ste14